MKTLKKTVIAVVDSGISEAYYKSSENIKGGICFYWNEHSGKVESGSNFFDENGHGTNCVDLITRFLPEAEIYIVKILDAAGKTNSMVLEAGLKHLCGQLVNIINLSLAVKNHKREIEELCNILSQEGKIISASVENGAVSSVPALYKSVYGVAGGIMERPFQYSYRENQEINLICDATPVITRTVKDNFTFFGGNSKAACMFTIIAAKILEKKSDTAIRSNNLKECLIQKSKISEKLTCLKGYPEFRENKPIEEIKSSLDVEYFLTCICHQFQIGRRDALERRLYELGNPQQCCQGILKVIRQIEKKEEAKVDMKYFSLRDMEWLWCFLEYIEKNRKERMSDGICTKQKLC